MARRYLRNYVSAQQRAWVKWLHLGECFYNTTYHMSIGMAPFKALDESKPLSFIDTVMGDSHAPRARDWLQEGQNILRCLKDNLQRAQNQQKMYADKHRMERSFEVGDLVYLRLHPYQQSSLEEKGKENLKPQFYGPYRITHRIGEVAYELELPEGSHIHNVFRVSCLRKVVGKNVIVATDLRPLNEEGKLILEPTKIIEVRENTLQNRTVKEYLVR